MLFLCQKSARGGEGMYKWLKEYFTAFGKDFPFSAVADLNEYEIIRIIQYCIKTNTEYKADTEKQIKSESDETFAGQRISHLANDDD